MFFKGLVASENEGGLMRPKRNAPFHLFFLTVLSFLLVSFLITETLIAGSIRKPVWAGRFYPANPAVLRQTIEDLTDLAKQTHVNIPPHKSLKALILPHAGYIYSGVTAAHASLVLKPKRYEKVILLGPDHRVGFRNGAISSADSYETPLGRVGLHRDVAILREQTGLFEPIPSSQDSEHSLEVILPFLQTYLNQFELVPIVIGQGGTLRITDALNSLIDEETLLVISSDLSHFLPYHEAVVKDMETIRMILNFEADLLTSRENCACGKIPLSIVLELARTHGWEPVLLHYSNSGDTAGDRSRVVGYAAIAFYGDATMQKNQEPSHFNENQGQALIQLARQTIMAELGRRVENETQEALQAALKDERLQASCGTFVTLKINNQLRGCIGNLTATEPLPDSVRKNAINAAFHDYRFSPLTSEELDRVEVEVSVLTEPQSLEYTDGKDLISKLRVNVDGVIIRKGSASATFLPQVWEQLPRPEDFLNHLCQKAGLSPNAWQATPLKVSTYQVQYFEETK